MIVNTSQMLMITVPIWLSLILIIIGVAGGFFCGYVIDKSVTENKIKKSENKAARIIEEAYAEIKTIKKEALLEAKEEVQRIKSEADEDIRERKFEIQKQEDRLAQKEELLNKKEETIDKKLENIEQAKLGIEEKEKQIQLIKEDLFEEKEKINIQLEKVSQMSREEAKKTLISVYEEEAKRDAVKLVREIEEEAKDIANKKAQNIVTLAIQKCATDHTSEVTVSSVTLPNEEMKGRIIGREGRNIRALENATGVDIIIDDTPESLVISAFDPVRREIARQSLEKLIIDGRIHPTRIEEIVEKVKREIDQTIKEAGENAAFDADIHGLHPEIIRTLGRLKYRTSYGQNVLVHSLEVCHLAGLLAAEVGADIKIAKRGGLLHDIGKALDQENEGTHVSLGVDLCRKYKENESVVHCIEAHHGGVEFKSVEAILVQVADAISSSRPGARRESLENYIKRLTQLESIAKENKGVENAYAIQAGREVRIIVKPEEISDADALFLAKDVAKKIEDQMQYPGQIKVNVIRESRSIVYAK